MLGRVHPDAVVLAASTEGWASMKHEMGRHTKLPLIFVDDETWLSAPPAPQGHGPAAPRFRRKSHRSKTSPSQVLRMGCRSIMEYSSALKEGTLAKVVHDTLARVEETTSMRRMEKTLSKIAG